MPSAEYVDVHLCLVHVKLHPKEIGCVFVLIDKDELVCTVDAGPDGAGISGVLCRSNQSLTYHFTLVAYCLVFPSDVGLRTFKAGVE